MPEAYYFIPMVSGPYNRSNPQRPDYVDEIRANWVGHNVDSLGYYVCKVNTTEAKHADLASRAGVLQLPRGYTVNTRLSSLPPAARNAISNWCNQRDIPYDDETLEELLMRVVQSGIFVLGNVSLLTEFSILTTEQQNKITEFCIKWGIALPNGNESVRQIVNRSGLVSWNPSRVWVEEG